MVSFFFISAIQGGRIFDGLGGEITAWMSHGDEAEKIPSGFKVIGSTENSAAAAIVSESESVFGLQFHPEVAHTEHGSKILENFAVNICGAKKNGPWNRLQKHPSSKSHQ